MKKKYNIVYLTTYIDEEISNKINLPYTSAGLKKKNQILEILSDHNVEIVFVSMFSRFKKIFIKSFVKKKNSIIIRVPFFIKLPFFNYLLNPIFTFIELYKIQKEKKIDFIILYNCVYENVIPAYFMYKLFNIKIICQYEDGWIFVSKGFKRFIYKLAHALGEKISEGLIVNSTTFLDLFKKKEYKYIIFRGNIENNKFCINNEIVKNKKKLNVLFSSSLDDIRGVELLIEFFYNVKEKEIINSFYFQITGQGSKKIIKKLNDAILYYESIGGSAKYYGFISLEELSILYKKADILLALQKPDVKFSKYCFPSKIFEYYQYNKPIITTNISDLKNDDFFNLEFIEYNIESLKEKLLMIKKDYNKYSQKNKENSSILSKRFSINENKKLINRFLEELYGK